MDQEKKPLVSIVIPTYNRPEFLQRAVTSVICQTYSNIEIIIVDDHSDSNLEFLKNKFPTVRLFRNSKNMGPCFSRNHGLKEAKGDYINFLDDDDELFPEKIEMQIEKFKTSGVENLGFVTAHALDLRSGKKIIKKNTICGDIYKNLLAGYAISGTETLLFKKECLMQVGGFDVNLQSSQEYDLLIRLSEKYSIDYVDKILSRENRSLDQISLNFDKKISGAKHLFRKYDSHYKNIGTLFWMKMRLKRSALLSRFMIGKWFGEKAYRLTIRD